MKDEYRKMRRTTRLLRTDSHNSLTPHSPHNVCGVSVHNDCCLDSTFVVPLHHGNFETKRSHTRYHSQKGQMSTKAYSPSRVVHCSHITDETSFIGLRAVSLCARGKRHPYRVLVNMDGAHRIPQNWYQICLYALTWTDM